MISDFGEKPPSPGSATLIAVLDESYNVVSIEPELGTFRDTCNKTSGGAGPFSEKHTSGINFSNKNRFEELVRNNEIKAISFNISSRMYLACIAFADLDSQYINNELKVGNNDQIEFISNLSHEIKTPLNAIKGFSELSLIDIKNKDFLSLKENMTAVLKATDHLTLLVNEILDHSRIESGRHGLFIERFNLIEVINEISKLLEPLASRHEVNLTTLLNNSSITGSPKVILSHDKLRVKQVLINIINNAIKYNIKNGEVLINIKSDQTNLITIQVIDTGKGIPSNMTEEIFSRFTRVTSDDLNAKGHGLGLAISKELLTLMGGDISLDNSNKNGSTFTVSIPVVFI